MKMKQNITFYCFDKFYNYVTKVGVTRKWKSKTLFPPFFLWLP